MATVNANVIRVIAIERIFSIAPAILGIDCLPLLFSRQTSYGGEISRALFIEYRFRSIPGFHQLIGEARREP